MKEPPRLHCQSQSSMDGTPDFARPLASCMTTPEEALRIRQALTRYLLSQQLKSVDDEPICHLSASTGCNVDSVKRNPRELDGGIYARYLEALGANLAARNAYNEALQDLTALKQQEQKPTTTRDCPPSGGQELRAYLSMLRSRRERERALLLRRYLDKLNSMEAALPDYLALDGEPDRASLLAQDLGSDRCADSASATDDGAGTIVRNLERDVLQTKQRLDRAQKERDTARSRNSDSAVDITMRLKALSRVRDEMVLWVEEKLATASTDTIVANDRATDADVGSALVSLTTKKMRIQEQYKAYIAARRTLLHTVSAASCPLPKDDKEASLRHEPSTEPSQEVGGTDPTAILANACQSLLPLSDAQEAAAVQRSYLFATLEKEKRTTGKSLERLQEESHLLSERNTTADIVDQAEAWALASTAAGNATNDYVEEKLELGTGMARSAEVALQDLYGTMNADYVEATTKNDSEKEQTYGKDIRSGESGAARSRRSVGKGARLEAPVNGPWSGLDGKVGVIGDG